MNLSKNLDLFLDEWLWLNCPLPDEKAISWTDEELVQLFYGLLKHSLKTLTDPRTSRKTYWEIYHWITADFDPHPFSFFRCCEVSGVDSDQLRGAVFKKIRTAQKKMH